MNAIATVCWLFMVAMVSSEIEDGIQYLVGAGRKDCFYRVLSKDDVMDFDAQVLSGGEIDLTVVIKSFSNGEIYLKEEKRTEISQEMTITEDGPVEICFDNTFSMFSDKVVYFDLGIDETGNRTGLDHEELFPGLDLAKDDYDDANLIMKSLEGIGIKFEIINQLQAIFKSRYKRHRLIQERNLSLVTWFSLISCVVMLAVALLQVYLIRSLFESKHQRPSL